MKKLELEVWSDVVCPWCFVGKRRLEKALAALETVAHASVVWRAFELDPSAPAVHPAEPTHHERLAKKYGLSPAQAEQMLKRMESVGAQEDIAFDFAKLRSGNSFDAHRLLCLARERGLQNELKERLFKAYFTEGASIGDHQVLTSLGVEVGLDPDEVSGVLESDDFASEVRTEERTAMQLGVRGVPFFVIANKYGVSGAQPVEVLVEVLERALGEASEESPVDGQTDGSSSTLCTPAGCD